MTVWSWHLVWMIAVGYALGAVGLRLVGEIIQAIAKGLES